MTLAGRGRSRTLSRRWSPGGYNPASAAAWGTQPHSVFWAEDPAWTAPADGAAVSSWRNGGSNGTAATQATGANQPLFRSSGINGKPSIQGDGVNDLLRQAAFTSVPQPFNIIVIGAMSSNAAAGKFMFDSRSAPAQTAIYTNTGNTEYSLWGGGAISSVVTVNTAAHLFRGYFNGASSALGVDETLALGNGGTNAITGLTIGSSAAGGTAGTAGYIAFAMLYAGDVTADSGWTTFKAWVRTHYGLTIA